MHGRVKVRTTEQEKARKEKERQEKLKLFKYAMQIITIKRKNNELDKELLDIIAQVLQSNPDIYTLWNIRRQAISNLVSFAGINEGLSKLFDDELNLTEYCLKINPKSYCAWHQREWVLTTRKDPDWKKELMLCEKYLKYDERNFHTWDYRRFVVAQCKPSLKDEFDFTTDKLHENFSNYSAWHYRSKMLIELYPDLEAGRPIEDSHHKHELELVQSAAFTDPDDTSAWFYQRWLLGAVKVNTQVVLCTVSASHITVAFNKSVPLDVVKGNVNIIVNGTALVGDWHACTANYYNNMWILKTKSDITDDADIRLEFTTDSNEKQIIDCIKLESRVYVGKAKINFQNQYSKPVIEELKKQLESCRQLLDLEPDNRWTLLTTTVFLHCIDPKLYHKEAIANLHTLKALDKLRAGYYQDLITKWSIEDQITADYIKKTGRQLKYVFDDKVTSLPHLQYYSHCDIVDLSNQHISSHVLPSLVVLQHCKVLNLENNNLTTLKGFPDLKLEELNLKGNKNLDAEEVKLFKQQRVFINVVY